MSHSLRKSTWFSRCNIPTDAHIYTHKYSIFIYHFYYCRSHVELRSISLLLFIFEDSHQTPLSGSPLLLICANIYTRALCLSSEQTGAHFLFIRIHSPYPQFHPVYVSAFINIAFVDLCHAVITTLMVSRKDGSLHKVATDTNLAVICQDFLMRL